MKLTFLSFAALMAIFSTCFLFEKSIKPYLAFPTLVTERNPTWHDLITLFLAI
jgi:hypothetical protein